MQENNQPKYEKDMHGQMHDSLAFIIGLVISFFASPFIIVFTKDLVIPFAGAITGGGIDEFTAGFIWGVCVYGGVFFAVTYFIHIKLTVMGTKMITKQFEPEAAHKNQKEKSGAGAFIKGALFMLLALLAIGSLTGCKEQENHYMNQQILKDKEIAFKLEQGREAGRQERRITEMQHENKQILREKFYKFLGVAIKFLAVVGGVVGVIAYIVRNASIATVRMVEIRTEYDSANKKAELAITHVFKNWDKFSEEEKKILLGERGLLGQRDAPLRLTST